MKDQPVLMHQLTPSRARRKVGEIFVMEFDAGYVTGRVIRTDAEVFMGDPGANLLYIFKGLRSRLDAPLPSLSADNLLFPPVFTNNLGWSRGYYQTIEVRDLALQEVLPQHCFLNRPTMTYWDEYHNQLPGPVGVVSDQSLHSYLTIEDEIARTLGWGGTITD